MNTDPGALDVTLAWLLAQYPAARPAVGYSGVYVILMPLTFAGWRVCPATADVVMGGYCYHTHPERARAFYETWDGHTITDDGWWDRFIQPPGFEGAPYLRRLADGTIAAGV